MVGGAPLGCTGRGGGTSGGGAGWQWSGQLAPRSATIRRMRLTLDSAARRRLSSRGVESREGARQKAGAFAGAAPADDVVPEPAAVELWPWRRLSSARAASDEEAPPGAAGPARMPGVA